MKKIYITNNKNEILKQQTTSLKDIKIITENVLLMSYPYKYSPKIINYIMNTYNVIYDIALIYYKNIIKYPIENSNNEKCLFLAKLKKELINNNLLKENKLYHEYLKNKEIIIDEKISSKYLNLLLKDYNVTIKEEEKQNYLPKVYVLPTKEEEIIFVLESIASLIRNGVSPNHIFLTNIKKEDLNNLKRISTQMHIPINFPKTTKISETTIGLNFLKGNEINPQTKEEEIIYNQIIDIINKYVDIENPDKLITYDLKHTTVKETTKKEGINIINIKTMSFKDDDYVFFFNCNNEIPHIYKDEEYLNDLTREELKIDTSTDYNKKEQKTIKQIFQNIKNLTITYSEETYPSILLKEYVNEPGKLLYNASHDYNKYTYAKMLDEYTLYGTTTPLFFKMANTYELPYKTYSNKYTPISNQKLKITKLNLSYTKLNTYLSCSYEYFLKYILNLDNYEETFNIIIGNIFHKILEDRENDEFDYDYSFQKACKEYEFTPKEKMLLRNLKEEFRFVLNIFQERINKTDLTNNIYEKEITKQINPNLTFKGKIDIISYNEDTYKITDYKTGNASIDTSIMPLGFSMQLPTYLYLLQEDEEFENKQCGGFYLQPILLDKVEEKLTENYEQTKKKAYKAIGYSTNNFNILEKVDYTYPDSIQIRGMKTTQKNEFYPYTKTFKKEDLETLTNLVETKINEVSKNIFSGDFPINPKILDNKTKISCEYCRFKDICYHTPKDNIFVESDKTFMKEVKKDGMDN